MTNDDDGVRQVDDDEDDETVDPPFELSGAALECWQRLRLPAGLDVDVWIAAAAYAATFGRVVDLEGWISANGPVVTIRDDKGNIKSHGQSPRVGLLRDERLELGRLRRALGSFGVFEVPDRRVDESTNRYAVELTLEELADRDDLRPIDAARVQIVRLLASAVDDEPDSAALWRQYREAVEGLFDEDEDSGSDLGEQLAALMRPEVRDSSPR